MEPSSLSSKSNHPLVHKLLDELRQNSIQAQELLVAVSGGCDSVCLLDLLTVIAPILKLRLRVAHIHHGPCRALKQNAFRLKAFKHVQKLAKDYGLEFVSNARQEAAKKIEFHLAPEQELKGESELREFRYRALRQYKNSSQWLVLAHTADDLLETRMIRLIRGTGPQGIEAMKAMDEDKLRPLLQLSREQILAYARGRKLKWLEDPSNKSIEPMRNWLRRSWLEALEKKYPGAKMSLARSLSHLAQGSTGPSELWAKALSQDGINRQIFLELSREDQKRVLARYMRILNLSGYGRNHIEEILKRLDNSTNDLRFKLLKCDWYVSRDLIRASRN